MSNPTANLNFLRWRESRHLRRAELSPVLRGWLLDTGSLTLRLQRRCTGRFSVKVLSLGWARVSLDEAQALSIRPDQRCLVREVQLFCDEVPWVFARTLIPAATLTGRQRRLAHLGSRPLGAFLFSDPSMTRGPVEVASLMKNSRLYQHALRGVRARPARIWGRRSVFRLQGKPLLVSEIFLPALGQ